MDTNRLVKAIIIVAAIIIFIALLWICYDKFFVKDSSYSFRYTCPFSTSNTLHDSECFDKDGNKYPVGDEHCKEDETPKGLDVVFRTVQLINVKDCAPDDTGVCKGDATTINNDLNTAFPGRTGKGRYTNGKKIGSNWLTIDEDENKNTKRIFDILDNMIYAQPDPSYHIVLDTGKINYIREQNKKYRDGTIDTKHIKSDPYTDSRYFKFDKTNATDYATAAQGTKADNAMPKSGGTFTGAVTLAGAPTTDLNAATKKYVDDTVAAATLTWKTF